MPSTQPLPLNPERAARRRELFAATFDWLVQTLGRPLPEDWRLIEIGAGRHGWAPLYQQHVPDVVALDLIDYSLDNPDVNYVVGDLVGDIPLDDAAFDIAVSHSVLEHVADLGRALANIDRILKVGGYAFLTVSPLYFSAQGAHMRYRGIEQWEHLNPSRAEYMTDNPLPNDPDGGHFLNQMTWSTFMQEIGRLPWDIVRTRLAIDQQPLPDWLSARGEYREMDLRCRGFYLLARKLVHFKAPRMVDVAPDPRTEKERWEQEDEIGYEITMDFATEFPEG